MSELKEIGGRFVIEDTLVKRPSSTIYRGKDLELGGLEVAIKVYVDRPEGNQEWIDSFESEIKTLRAATHGSSIPIIAGGYDQEFFYLAMEMVDKLSLRDRLHSNPRAFGLEESILIISEIAEALGEIHSLNIIHGHVDSRSVLFKGGEPRLAGYYPLTIEKILKSTTSQSRLVVESAYISPEQVNSSDNLSASSDIYSLSILLFEMLTGQRPFVANNPIQLAMMRLNQAPPSPRSFNPNIPVELDAAIQKGLAIDPKDRFTTVDDFIDAINLGKSNSKNPLATSAPLDEETQTASLSMTSKQLQELLMVKAQYEASIMDSKSEPLSVDGEVDETKIGNPVPKKKAGAYSQHLLYAVVALAVAALAALSLFYEKS